jgi:hypothetical protein
LEVPIRRKLLGPDGEPEPEKTPEQLAAEKEARKQAAKEALKADSRRADVAQACLRAMYV